MWLRRVSISIVMYAAAVLWTTVRHVSADEPPLSEAAFAIAELESLPGVASIQTTTPTSHPTHCIIHILDWHYVPKRLFEDDLRDQGLMLAPDELDRRYREFLDEVDAVQSSQMMVLRALGKQNGVRQVFQEGLTQRDMPIYRSMIRVLGLSGVSSSMLRDSIAKTEESIAEARDNSHGQVPTLESIRRKTVAALDRYLTAALPIGASGRLRAEGFEFDVRPLDDEKAFAAAKPINDAGEVILDEAAIEAREDAMLRLAFANSKSAVIVLGGAHDLADNLERLYGGDCQYIRLVPSGYDDAAGKAD